MAVIPVRLKNRSYDIIVGSKILPNLGQNLNALKIGKNAVIVTNPTIRRIYGKVLTKCLHSQGFSIQILEVPDSEESKSAHVAFGLLNRIARYDRSKNIFILAFGGGVVGDLAGFVAATYKRGIPYIQVPTTLLAQIDSAIGGKTAIDLVSGKNLVGAFYQPRLVFSDVSFLSSLPVRQIQSGLAEAVKYGIIRDENLFDYLEKNHGLLLKRQPKPLTEVVLKCSRIKAQVVMKDEKETLGIRTILNFGHTVGHAIEAASNYRVYSHGEAVALGMCVAGEMSVKLGLWNEQGLRRMDTLLTQIGLPQKIKKVNLKQLLASMQHDKKFKGGKNRFVLVDRIGKVSVRQNVPQEVIVAAIKARM